jgi:hypothetical protein
MKRRPGTIRPRKPARRVPLVEVIQWLDQHQAGPRGRPGRPHAGHVGLSSALAAAFQVHPRTAKRLLVRVRQREQRIWTQQVAAAGLDPATASLVRALADRYKSKTVTATLLETVTPSRTPSRMPPKRLASQEHAGETALYSDALVAAVGAWLAAAPDHVRALLHAPLSTAGPAACMGLSAVGVFPTTAINPLKAKAYDAVEGVCESLDAALAGGDMPPKARQLAHDLLTQLRGVQPPRRPG